MKKRFYCVDGVALSQAEETDLDKSQPEPGHEPQKHDGHDAHAHHPGSRHPWMRHRRRAQGHHCDR